MKRPSEKAASLIASGFSGRLLGSALFFLLNLCGCEIIFRGSQIIYYLQEANISSADIVQDPFNINCPINTK